jgi:hypothetical protein
LNTIEYLVRCHCGAVLTARYRTAGPIGDDALVGFSYPWRPIALAKKGMAARFTTIQSAEDVRHQYRCCSIGLRPLEAGGARDPHHAPEPKCARRRGRSLTRSRKRFRVH